MYPIDMKTICIYGDNRHETFTKTRIACRGIVLQDGKLLLSREERVDWWLIPGGGLEEGEDCVSCCVREVEEETGYRVRPIREFLVMEEYYEEWRYVSHYFICEITGEGRQALTEQEKKRGLVPKRLPLSDALLIFAKHQDFAGISEEKRGSYLREYTALCTYMEDCAE